MMCGNLGLAGDWGPTRRLLTRLGTMTVPGGLLIGDSVDPASIDDLIESRATEDADEWPPEIPVEWARRWPSAEVVEGAQTTLTPMGPPQNSNGLHGAGSQPNIASALASAPGVRSSTLPARCSCRNVVPPR